MWDLLPYQTTPCETSYSFLCSFVNSHHFQESLPHLHVWRCVHASSSFDHKPGSSCEGVLGRGVCKGRVLQGAWEKKQIYGNFCRFWAFRRLEWICLGVAKIFWGQTINCGCLVGGTMVHASAFSRPRAVVCFVFNRPSNPFDSTDERLTCLHNLPESDCQLFCHLSFKSFWQVPEAQIFAHLNAGVEGLDAEVHRAVDVPQVGQLDPEEEDGEEEKRNNSVWFYLNASCVS